MIQPIKILLFTPVWKHPNLTRLHFENVKRIVNHKPETFDITPFFVVSEDWAIDLCDEFGFRYHFTENLPLGRKLNTGLRQVINEPFDWLMTNGSDDFVNPRFLNEYLPYFESSLAFGQSKIYLMNAKTCEQKSWHIGYAFGALRCIRFDLVRQTAISKGAYGGLWGEMLNRGLDYYSMLELEKRTGKKIEVVNIKNKLWDVKTGESINRWNKFKGEPLDIPVDELPLEIRYLNLNQPA